MENEKEIDQMLEEDDDIYDENEENIEDLDEQIEEEKFKNLPIILVVIIAILAIIVGGAVYMNGKRSKEIKATEKIAAEAEKPVEDPNEVHLENGGQANVGQIDTTEAQEEMIIDDKKTDDSSVITETDRNKTEVNHNFPMYPETAELIEMDMESIEIYDIKANNSYVTLYVGDKNGSRAHINIDKTAYGCNEDLGVKLAETENKMLLARLDSILTANSSSSDYEDMQKNYINKYKEYAANNKYVLLGYRSDYKLKSVLAKEKEESIKKEKETSTATKTNNKSSSSSTSSSSDSQKKTTSNKSSGSSSSSSNKSNNASSKANNSSAAKTSNSKTSSDGKITIEYVLNDGINSSSNPTAVAYDKVDEFILFPATKDGYNFDGWYVDADFQTAFQKLDKSQSKVILYAKFSRNLTSLKASTKTIILNKDKSYNVNNFITTSPANYVEGLEYVSSDENILTVGSDGTISIKGYGKCSITVKKGELSTTVNFKIDHTHDWVEEPVEDENGNVSYQYRCAICGEVSK